MPTTSIFDPKDQRYRNDSIEKLFTGFHLADIQNAILFRILKPTVWITNVHTPNPLYAKIMLIIPTIIRATILICVIRFIFNDESSIALGTTHNELARILIPKTFNNDDKRGSEKKVAI